MEGFWQPLICGRSVRSTSFQLLSGRGEWVGEKTVVLQIWTPNLWNLVLSLSWIAYWFREPLPTPLHTLGTVSQKTLWDLSPLWPREHRARRWPPMMQEGAPPHPRNVQAPWSQTSQPPEMTATNKLLLFKPSSLWVFCYSNTKGLRHSYTVKKKKNLTRNK